MLKLCYGIFLRDKCKRTRLDKILKWMRSVSFDSYTTYMEDIDISILSKTKHRFAYTRLDSINVFCILNSPFLIFSNKIQLENHVRVSSMKYIPFYFLHEFE